MRRAESRSAFENAMTALGAAPDEGRRRRLLSLVE